MMRCLVALSLSLLGCGREVPATTLELPGSGLPPAATELTAAPLADRGFTFANLRPDGALWAVDLVANDRVAQVYGLALRLELHHALLVRGEAAEAWPLVRFETTRAGAVAVLSESGARSPHTLPGGRVATVWLKLEPRVAGAIALDAAHCAALDPDGATLPLAWGRATWSWN